MAKAATPLAAKQPFSPSHIVYERAFVMATETANVDNDDLVLYLVTKKSSVPKYYENLDEFMPETSTVADNNAYAKKIIEDSVFRRYVGIVKIEVLTGERAQAGLKKLRIQQERQQAVDTVKKYQTTLTETEEALEKAIWMRNLALVKAIVLMPEKVADLMKLVSPMRYTELLRLLEHDSKLEKYSTPEAIESVRAFGASKQRRKKTN